MAGVHGIVDKNVNTKEFLRAINAVASGSTYFSQTVRVQFRAQRLSVQKYLKTLSRTELTLLPLFGKGLSDEQIGEHRKISAATAQTHRRNIMNKLSLRSSIDLVRHSLENGFVQLRGDGALQATPKFEVSSSRSWTDACGRGAELVSPGEV